MCLQTVPSRSVVITVLPHALPKMVDEIAPFRFSLVGIYFWSLFKSPKWDFYFAWKFPPTCEAIWCPTVTCAFAKICRAIGSAGVFAESALLGKRGKALR